MKNRAIAKKKDVVKYVIYIVTLLFYAWVTWSFIDISMHNMSTDYTYSKFNAFELLCKLNDYIHK